MKKNYLLSFLSCAPTHVHISIKTEELGGDELFP